MRRRTEADRGTQVAAPRGAAFTVRAWPRAAFAALLLGIVAPRACAGFVTSGGMPQALRRAPGASAAALCMQEQEPRALSRRALAARGVAAAAAAALAPQYAEADMLDIVTGAQKSNDFLARLKVGKVYLPTLKCNSSMPCWNRDPNFWYDYPDEDELDQYTTTPSGLKMLDLPVNPDLAELVKTSPTPDIQEGTNNIEVFVAGYLMSPRYRTATDEAIADYYDPESKKSKYYDVRNRDPRMFQIGKVALALGKSKLIKGFEEGLSTMRVGMRRSLIIPPELAYGEAGTEPGTAFLKPIPPNGQLLYQIELQKIIRG